jgi:hypothetical protein
MSGCAGIPGNASWAKFSKFRQTCPNWMPRFNNRSFLGTTLSFLSSRAKRADLRFRGPLLETRNHKRGSWCFHEDSVMIGGGCGPVERGTRRAHRRFARLPSEPVTFSIFSCFLHSNQLNFKPPNKAVILRACDFFDLFVFSAFQPAAFQAPQQSRHPERSASQIYRKQRAYSAKSKDPGDAC